MRIISGALRGRKLNPLKEAGIRPTSDRVREAIFSILYTRIEDANVADIFAGTGAMGIEALSRGAARVVFVDNNPAALSIINTNLESFSLQDQAEAIRWDVTKSAQGLARSGVTFDIVFVDPPYRTPSFEFILENLAASKALNSGALIVFEHSSREKPQPKYDNFELTDQRKYGKTLVSFFSFML